jgi:hypothetical protein
MINKQTAGKLISFFGKTCSGSFKFISVNESTIDGCSVNLIDSWLISPPTVIASTTVPDNSSANSSSLSTIFVSFFSTNGEGLTWTDNLRR